jgi:hypothetical protein
VLCISRCCELTSSPLTSEPLFSSISPHRLFPSYDRQIAAIIAPAACGIIGIVLINTGLFVINMAYKFSKNNPVSVPVELEGKTLDKVAKRFEVSGGVSKALRSVKCFGYSGFFNYFQ